MQHEPSPAAGIAAALGAHAEAVCRRYLPHGRKHGRYWIAGDIDGARGRSLFVRLHGPGVPGKWTDAATGEHGDLLDLIRHRSRAPSLRAALDEARAFLALPVSPATGSGDSFDATEAARRLWRQCRTIAGTHAEAYLHARGLSRCRFAALRFHPELRYRDGNSVRRFPALVAAVTGNDNAVLGVQRTWLDPRRPAKAGVATPRKALGRIHGFAVRFGHPADGATLLVGEGIETVLSVVAAVPEFTAAAALSAGSLGAFAPPPGVARLVIARDNDPDGAHRGRTPRPALRAGRRRRHRDRPRRQRFQRRPRRPGRAGAPRQARAARPLRGRERRAEWGARPFGERRESMDAVVNLRNEPKLREAFEYAHVHNNTVLIDRRTKWGNPFRIGRDGTRDEVIARYRADLWRRIRAGETALEELAELDGCWLACHCDPLPCHGHVLERAAAWASGVLAERAGG